MNDQIKKQNEAQALRVFNISKHAQHAISEIENDLIRGKSPDSGIYQVIEGYKKDIDKIGEKYLNHIEECTLDLFLVEPELIDGLKKTFDLMVNNLKNYFTTINESIISKGSAKHPNLFFPDYL